MGWVKASWVNLTLALTQVRRRRPRGILVCVVKGDSPGSNL